MKKTILIGALALALGACSEQPKENSNVIHVDIENEGLYLVTSDYLHIFVAKIN